MELLSKNPNTSAINVRIILALYFCFYDRKNMEIKRLEGQVNHQELLFQKKIPSANVGSSCNSSIRGSDALLYLPKTPHLCIA